MPRQPYESEGTWFSKEARAERDRFTWAQECAPTWADIEVRLGDKVLIPAFEIKSIHYEPPPTTDQLLIGPTRRTQFGPMCRVIDCPRLMCVYGKGMFCAEHQDRLNAGAMVMVAINAGRGTPTKCTNPAHMFWSGGRWSCCAGPVTSYRQRLGVPMAGANPCTP